MKAVHCGKGEENEKDGWSHVMLANSILIIIQYLISLLVYSTHAQYIVKVLLA